MGLGLGLGLGLTFSASMKATATAGPPKKARVSGGAGAMVVKPPSNMTTLISPLLLQSSGTWLGVGLGLA